jgi:hypothetical protein
MLQILFDLVRDRFGNADMIERVPLTVRMFCEFEAASLCYETWCCAYDISCLHTETKLRRHVVDRDLNTAAKKAIGVCYPDD